MGRKKQYTDPFHDIERIRVQRYRLLHKGAMIEEPMKSIINILTSKQTTINNSATITPKFDDPYLKTIIYPIKNQPTALTPKTIDPKLAALVQSKTCSTCKDSFNCRELCENYKKLYEYEKIQQKNRNTAKNKEE